MKDLEIDPRELHRRLTQGEDLFLLDVRETWEFQTGHIDGSELIPLGQLPEHLDDLVRDREIIVICHHGVRSLNAAHFLRHQGFLKVKSLAGGIDLWSSLIDPKLPKY